MKNKLQRNLFLLFAVVAFGIGVNAYAEDEDVNALLEGMEFTELQAGTFFIEEDGSEFQVTIQKFQFSVHRITNKEYDTITKSRFQDLIPDADKENKEVDANKESKEAFVSWDKADSHAKRLSELDSDWNYRLLTSVERTYVNGRYPDSKPYVLGYHEWVAEDNSYRDVSAMMWAYIIVHPMMPSSWDDRMSVGEAYRYPLSQVIKVGSFRLVREPK